MMVKSSDLYNIIMHFLLKNKRAITIKNEDVI